LKSSLHDLSHSKAFSGYMGTLTPIGWVPVLPGDHFQHSTTALVRTQPLLAPLMHRVDAKIFHFFVPNRLLWDNWQDFITGGPDGMNASVHPYVSLIPPLVPGSLQDFLGVAPFGEVSDPALPVNALPFRAYNLIFNQYFRDQDLVAELPVPKSDGADATDYQLMRPAWKKDYYTLARPEPMKGPEITVPVQGEAPVLGIGKNNQNFPSANVNGLYESDGTTSNYANASEIDPSNGDERFYVQGTAATSGYPNIRAFMDGAYVDALDFREAFAQLRFQELRSRYGSEYVDYLAFLGVKSSDARLQRAEYLGGGAGPIQFSEVLQTAPEDAGDPVGALKGHGISAKRTNRYRRYFEEHGIVMTLMYIAPTPVYGNTMPREFFKTTKEDYWQPEYEHVGQQAIMQQEVWPGSANRTDPFGWIDRYEEYRSIPSTIAGEFRTTNYDYWTMARIWDTEPALNEEFIELNPTNRVYPATNEENVFIFVNHNLKARRKVTNKPRGYIY